MSKNNTKNAKKEDGHFTKVHKDHNPSTESSQAVFSGRKAKVYDPTDFKI